jgi:hypothetical protein
LIGLLGDKSVLANRFLTIDTHIGCICRANFASHAQILQCVHFDYSLNIKISDVAKLFISTKNVGDNLISHHQLSPFTILYGNSLMLAIKETCKVESFIYGYHEYMDIWGPKTGEEYKLKREPENKKDSDAVAIVIPAKENKPWVSTSHPNTCDETVIVVGNSPKNMAPCVGKFLKCASNSGKVTRKGKQINHGAGYGPTSYPGSYLRYPSRFGKTLALVGHMVHVTIFSRARVG